MDFKEKIKEAAEDVKEGLEKGADEDRRRRRKPPRIKWAKAHMLRLIAQKRLVKPPQIRQKRRQRPSAIVPARQRTLLPTRSTKRRSSILTQTRTRKQMQTQTRAEAQKHLHTA